MVNKKDVHEFLDKVKAKALKSVREQYAVELEEAIEAALNEPSNHELRDAIKSYEHHVAEGVKAQKLINKYVPNSYLCLNQHDVKDDLFNRSVWYIPKSFEPIKAVHAQWEEKIRKVNDEYRKITQIIKNKKNGDQAKTALIALGFDVAYLDNLSNLPMVLAPVEIKVDTALLFPCKENGV